jgi:molybdopterin-containing oxidoreductase family membrane subunit
VEALGAWQQRLEETALAPVVRTSRWYYLWVAFLLAVLAWGVYAYSVQFRDGLIVTGMRDRISWGLYITTFVFFIGISHAGTLISAILRVTKRAGGRRDPHGRVHYRRRPRLRRAVCHH